MPKHVSQTRKYKAKALLDKLQRGPSWSFDTFGRVSGIELTPEQRREIQKNFEDSYRIWSQSWILTEVCTLIPELKDKLNSLGYYKHEETK